MRLASILAVLLVAACGGGSDDPLMDCGAGGSCPSGFTCRASDNKCVKTGTGGADAGVDAKLPDSGGGGGADAGIDAMTSTTDAQAVVDTMITGKPESPTDAAMVTFNFTSSPTGLTFQCKKDGGNFETCTSPTTYAVTEGTHTFAVKAQGDDTPAEATFVIDRTGPTTLITSGPQQDAAALPSGKFLYMTEETEPGATFECGIDTDELDPCTLEGFLFGPFADGTEHTFRVRAFDALGNEGPITERDFVTDAVGPVVTIVTPADGGSVSESFALTFTFPAETGATFVCQLDAMAEIEGCESGQLFMMIGPGAHTITVVGTDQLGNVGEPATSDFTVVPASTVSVVFPHDGETTGPVGTISYTVADAVSVVCMLDSKPLSCPVTGNVLYSDLMSGSHTFSVYGINAANEMGAPDSVTWNVDANGPFVNVEEPSDPRAGPGFSCEDGTIFFECDIGSSDPGDCPPDQFECELDNGGFDTCNDGQYDFNNIDSGPHSFTVHAIDLYENVGPDETVEWESFFCD